VSHSAARTDVARVRRAGATGWLESIAWSNGDLRQVERCQLGEAFTAKANSLCAAYDPPRRAVPRTLSGHPARAPSRPVRTFDLDARASKSTLRHFRCRGARTRRAIYDFRNPLRAYVSCSRRHKPSSGPLQASALSSGSVATRLQVPDV
jgi:hypothetical protein